MSPSRSCVACMAAIMAMGMLCADARAQGRIRVETDTAGSRLVVDGRPLMIRGMNWDYVPVGENYAYSLWTRPEAETERVLHRDMALLRDMHVNVIRVYDGMPARWIGWIFAHYGIYTVVNHTVGRYGLVIEGTYRAVTDYSDPRVRQLLSQDVARAAEEYRGTPGLLMWLLGNENNYGLTWESAAIADLPLARRDEARAEALYSLLGELIDELKRRDPDHPVALANGDLQYLDLIARHCPGLDVMGANVYRGRSAGDLYATVKAQLGKPFVFTEFGADAFDARVLREDERTQASYLRDQWREIDTQTSGHGLAGNAIGGFVFQWSDGWWKHLQESGLDVHDTHASWANGGYPEDLVPGENNMNEEWWGIMAKAPAPPGELSPLYPRAAYFLLRDGFTLDPYAESATPEAIRTHWDGLDVATAARTAAAERLASGAAVESRPVRLSDAVLELSTFTTGGQGLAAPERARTSFGHTESAFVGIEVEPTPRVRGRLVLNVLGSVATNPIDEIYFERRGAGTVKLYQGALTWNERWFELTGFHRTGHYHWGYEGDMFALYPEANYQRQVDAFDADAPSGFVFAGKRSLEGVKVAFGPELYWGANPAVIAKYHRKVGPIEFAAVHQHDVAQRTEAGTSSALPVPMTTKSTVYAAWTHGRLKLEAGGIVAGTDRVGRPYQAAEPARAGSTYLGSGYWVLDDTIRWYDTLGAKGKATWTGGRANAFVQVAYRGLVADSLPDQTITLTGFRLRESGQGNHYHVIAGAAFQLGNAFQIAPGVLYQKPLAGPLPSLGDAFDRATGTYFPGLSPRNQVQDPFWVRSNRETLGAELLLVFDPTPQTWFWQWDNAQRENAPFAASLDFSYRHLPTAQDAALGVLASGQVFAFPGSAPAHDLWELWARFVWNAGGLHVAGAAWLGTGQANGNDPRLIQRGGIEARGAVGRWSINGAVKANDWGPYDYHRDYNLTFPLQVSADAAWTLGPPRWFFPDQTKLGVAMKLRTMDEHSPRIDPVASQQAGGREWEVKSYVRFSL